MKLKTNELTGAALSWAVGLAEGYELNLYGVDPSIRARVPGLGVHAPWAPQRYWNQGGPIIEREKLDVGWVASDRCRATYDWLDEEFHEAFGPTPLIAAMRCYVASRLGDEVDVPEELV